MENGKIMLLMQLSSRLYENYGLLKESYENSEKKDFDRAKSAIIDIQRKINNILAFNRKK